MTYRPKPIDLSKLDQELNELQEAIAENAHDIWASKRIKEGWKFSEHRDDTKKETPDLVEYSRLPESEKEHDRAMALDTLKLIKQMGYDIDKKKIQLKDAIKALGTHVVPVKLHQKVTAELKVIVTEE